MEEYLAALDAGRPPDRLEFLASHADIAEPLGKCLDGLEFIHSAVPKLHSPNQDPPTPSAGEIHPEGPLGDFRILREAGRGGMGVVYEAMQISLGRRVALKVLPFAATMDSRRLQRFQNEARAAAGLHHTNIVPVYFVGSERGVHYYAMQFIEGRDLASVIAQLRDQGGRKVPQQEAVLTVDAADGEEIAPATVAAADTRPIAGLSTDSPKRSVEHFRTVARLGIQAAEALDHAHQMGIVHRDVKPANLLVDDSGRLWVTDFGLAQMQSDTNLTMTGDLVGTLRYMSPEQALAKRVVVDHRTDVYSLGATLYELLTLEPAFDGRNRQELLRQIAFEEPQRLRRLNRAVPVELEIIVAKALEKNPADRYATAQELADDLQRFLLDKPIQSRRPSLVRRARKWMLRNQAMVWSAAVAVVVVVAALVAATVVSSWQAVRAGEAQRRAEVDRDRAKAAERQAKMDQDRANAAERRAATEAAIARAVNDFLRGDLLGQVDSAPEISQEPGEDTYLTVKEALDRAAARIGQRFQDQPLVESAIRTTIGEAYISLSEHELAVPHLERAVTLRKAQVGPDSPDALRSMRALAEAYRRVSRYADSLALQQQILDNRMAQFGPDHPETLASVGDLARAYRSAGQWDTSVRLYEPLLGKYRTIHGPTHPATLDLMHFLAMTYGFSGRYTESMALYEKLLEHHRSTLGPEESPPVWPMVTYAQVCQLAGKFDQADRLLREALELLRKNKKSLHNRNDTANALGWLALNLLLQQRFEEAEPFAREAVALHQIEAHRRFCWVSVLGAVLLGQQKYAEAEPLLLQGYEGMRQREVMLPIEERRLLVAAGERVVRFYEVTNQPEKARAWRERVKPKLPDATSDGVK